MAAWHRRLFHLGAMVLLATGGLWLALHGPRRIDMDVVLESSPLEPWLLRVHGAAALVAIFCWGGAVTQHATRVWSLRHNRRSGIAMMIVAIGLTVSGYLLYYAGSDALRAGASAVHWLIGFTAPVVVFVHALRRHAAVANTKRSRETMQRPSDSCALIALRGQASGPARPPAVGRPSGLPAAAIRLSDLARGVAATIVELRRATTDQEHILVLRLAEIGFVPGERVHVIAHGHPGFEPIAVRVGNSTFGLRRFEAEYVRVFPDSADGPKQ